MRAIILCAGLGMRARPVTDIKPKPLLQVGGQSLIGRTVSQLRADGISDITLVTGYLAEQFEPVCARYKLRQLRSSQYAESNNYSSLLLAADLLEDCLILDGDLYLHRPILPLLRPGVSQFLAQETTFGLEWKLYADDTGIINKVDKNQPNGYAMSGVSYWTGEAARLLRAELPHCSPEEYWEDAAVRVLRQTPVYLTGVPHFQTEIDNCYQPVQLKLLTPAELAMQCDEDGSAERLPGLTNDNYLISRQGRKYVLRIPGLGTEAILDREIEPRLYGLFKHTDISPFNQFYENGIKISEYLDRHRMLRREQLTPGVFRALCGRLHELHAIPRPEDWPFKVFSVVEFMNMYERQSGINLLTPEERTEFYTFAEEMDADPPVLCHCDLLLENILYDGSDIKLIDFEYSNFTSPYWDLASFYTEARLTDAEAAQFFATYGQPDPQRIQRAIILVDYIWALWGIFKQYLPYARGRLGAMHTAYMHYLEQKEKLCA